MRLLIAGGGTGGHLFSGVAVADVLREHGDHTIHFVGTERGLEARVLPRLGLPLDLIQVGGLKRMGLWQRLVNLAKLPLSLLQSLRIIRHRRPQLVLGVGGYASGPVVLAAWMLRIPTVIIEQNSLPGVTNRVLGRLVRRVVIHFNRAATHFPQHKLVRLGNPVRPTIVRKAAEAVTPPSDGKLRLLITGGSQGAHALNIAMIEALPKLSDIAEQLIIHHQTGIPDWKMVGSAYQNSSIECEVEPFIDNIVSAYAKADLVVCRAGASTCAELAVVGRPALFIPLPTAADDHQTHNASELVYAGAAWMISQANLTADTLVAFIRERLEQRRLLPQQAEAARKVGHPDAAYQVADMLLDMVGEQTRPTSTDKIPQHPVRQ